MILSQNPGKLGKVHIRDFWVKVGNPRISVFRPQPLRLMYLFPLAIHVASQGLAGYVDFILTFFCEFKMCSVGLWRRSGVQGFRSEVSHIAFLGEVELRVLKLGHHCALKLWKGSGRELREDKEGIWIRVECLDCDQTAWEDSELPSLRTESQVDSSGKCYPLTTWHQPTGCNQIRVVVVRHGKP